MTAIEFKIYYERLRLPLGMYALRFTASVEEAEDVVQTVFMEAWHKVSEGFEPDDFKAYIYRAARNRALNLVRDNGRIDTVPIEYCEEEPSEEQIDTSERDARLWRAIDELPDRCRQVFLMSKRDGMSNAEIAGELGISVKTVEAQMTKAFSKLREDNRLNSGRIWFLAFC